MTTASFALRATDDTAIQAGPQNYNDLLPEILDALNWKGSKRDLAEVFTHHKNIYLSDDFLNAMVHLGYVGKRRHGKLQDIKESHYPVILIGKKGRLHIVHNREQADAYGDSTFTYMTFRKKADDEVLGRNAGLMTVFKRFYPSIRDVFVISLLIGVIALAPTIYNITLYDQVLPSGSSSTIPMLWVGVMIALIAEVFLRHMRNRNLSYLGARMDHYVSLSVFERLIHLPPIFTERASTSSQLARLRDFDSVREFFTGPLASLFFEMPLALLYLGAMALISGSLALVPLFLIVGYGILIAVAIAGLRESSRRASTATSQKHEFVIETLGKLEDIRLAGLEDVWQNRFEKLSRRASSASARMAISAQNVEVLSYILMTLGGLATLVFGVLLVLDETMTTGALIGSMILIWRIVSPFQLFCASITRIQQLESSTRQIQNLLSVSPEKIEHESYVSPFRLNGEVTFSRVSLRYTADAEPALLGVTFSIKPGQVVAIKGDNGSGKSTILKLILGLYTPQAGSVRLDGIDVRQFDPLALRQSIAYVPQLMEILPGTIRDNLLYTNPEATEAECIDALKRSLAWSEIEKLPHGLDTVIDGEDAETVSFMLKQRVNLARAYLKNTNLMLFDEASHSLGFDNDKAFMQTIRNFKHKRTIIMTTHREDHMRLADILIVMNKGELVHAGNPVQILSAMQGR